MADRDAVALLRRSSGLVVPKGLVLVASSFIELQDARHEADYSNDYDPSRAVTPDHVQTADEAIRATWSLWTAKDSSKSVRQDEHDAYRRFLQLALVTSGGPRVR